MKPRKRNQSIALVLLAGLTATSAATENVYPFHRYPGEYPDPDRPQQCKPDTRTQNTPTDRFIDNKDGTVTDKVTGLMWMRCTLGHIWTGATCEGDSHRSTWDVALKAVQDLNQKDGFAGHQDWRVPNIKELGTIVERACVHPAINLEVFPATEYWYYWASTPDAGITGHDWSLKQQWGIDFSDGKENVANFTKRRLRLVRDTK